ncbi:unnamed protein product [Lymnaea stagnalis]|uniref:Ig-like domain-containing protein n=1 Tax=Lymnaea stagnalis TaxID=6523 RepID=A0AAV2INA8_LYMST
MASRLFVLSFVCLFIQVCFTASIKVVLQATPSTIHPLLTRSLRLRCSLQRQQPLHDNTTNSSLSDVDQADGNTSHGDLTHVMSIVITKENVSDGQGEEVASVSTFDGPITEPPYSGSVRVEGSTNNSAMSGEQGYLEITWTTPPDTVSGLYSCQAFGLNAHNQPVALKTSAAIASELSLSDLVTFVSLNFNLVSELQTMIGSLNSTHDQRVARLEQQYEDLSFVYNLRVTELERANADLVHQISSLNATCCATNRNTTQSGTIQTGRLNCTSTASYVTYSRPFSEKPKVFTSVTHVSLFLPDGTSQVRVVDEDKAGCTIICNVPDSGIDVVWMAVE